MVHGSLTGAFPNRPLVTQRSQRISTALLTAGASWRTPTLVWAAEESAQGKAFNTGGSGLGLLCNISYAGMRAQDQPSRGWRITAFIFGFPGTLITYFAVPEGHHRAYGIELPGKTPGASR
jgi:hypothetical protein